MEKVYLQDWKRGGDRVRLLYQDGSELFVRYEDQPCVRLHRKCGERCGQV